MDIKVKIPLIQHNYLSNLRDGWLFLSLELNRFLHNVTTEDL